MQSAEKQKIPISFNSYNSFFDYLTQDCPKEPSAYISWDCTRSKKDIYKEVSSKWSVMKEKLLKAADPAKTVPLMHFVLQEITSKKGRLKKKLKSQITNAYMSYILNFHQSFSQISSTIVTPSGTTKQPSRNFTIVLSMFQLMLIFQSTCQFQ